MDASSKGHFFRGCKRFLVRESLWRLIKSACSYFAYSANRGARTILNPSGLKGARKIASRAVRIHITNIALSVASESRCHSLSWHCLSSGRETYVRQRARRVAPSFFTSRNSARNYTRACYGKCLCKHGFNISCTGLLSTRNLACRKCREIFRARYMSFSTLPSVGIQSAAVIYCSMIANCDRLMKIWQLINWPPLGVENWNHTSVYIS